jgi:FAD synthase
LEREGISTDIVETVSEEGMPISSSRIRETILAGKLKEAAAMLGRPFSFDTDGADITELKDGETVYNIASLGRILPPPGEYSVLLQTKNGGSTRKQIFIEKTFVRIPGEIQGCDFLEF